MGGPEFVVGNIYVRVNRFDVAGQKVDGHKHNFDHMTDFRRGSFHVKATCSDGRVIEQDFSEGEFVLIKADVEHEITCTSDGGGEFRCIYAHRDPQGSVTQKYTGWTKAYY